VQVATYPDVVFACVHPAPKDCRPCQRDQDCAVQFAGTPMVCAELGGYYSCLRRYEAGCGTGQQCQGVVGVEMRAPVQACVPESQMCECTRKSATEGAVGLCEVRSEHGVCRGEYLCTEEGRGSCSASTPRAEECNGLDDDCDGQTDEEFESSPCDLVNAYGICKGQSTCVGGRVLCQGSYAAPEVCNGLDDDCDGEVDEGFPDLDEDGKADCVDADQDGDGVPNYLDNCPRTANPDQADLDHDGIGDLCDPDRDGDGDSNETDCAPDDPAIFHGRTEICNNGVDDDCDGQIDEEGANGCVVYFFDEDGDGYGTAAQKCLCGPSGAYRAVQPGDCNDMDAEVNPGALEVCGNQKDDNCNGSDNDEGALGCVNFYEDSDSDGWGIGAGKCLCHGQGDITARKVGDCDDQDPGRNPGLDEMCMDHKDNDCDGETDEPWCVGCKTYYRDMDQDGYGVSEDKQCLGTAEYPYTAVVGGDCDDGNANVKPGAFEICNDLDDNCDGATDPIGTQGCQLLYPDADGDGYGALNQPAVCYCKPTGVYRATVSGDCLDSDASVNPQAVEVCDGKDNNCNGQVDEGVLQTYFKDADADGYGVAGDSRALCAPQAPYTALQSGDCDDADPERFPANPEVCDGKDNNCNGQVDEGVLVTFYQDNDGDGYGSSVFVQACTAPVGYVAKSGDCNDYNRDINPGASEVCNDIDDNCNGQIDEGLPTQKIYKDNDGDGFAAANAASQDKCNVPVGWTVAKDADGDGIPDWDCDDTDNTSYPGARELCNDQKDNDCNGVANQHCAVSCGPNFPVTLTGSANGWSAVVLEDVNNDGLLEALAGANLVSPTGQIIKSGFGGNPQDVRLTDIDNDGVTEFIFRDGLYRFSNGDFARVLIFPLATDPRYIAVGDIDADGVLDLVAAAGGTVRIWLLSVSGSSISVKRDTTISVPGPSGVTRSAPPLLADVNGDNSLEIFIGSGDFYHHDGRLYVFMSDGTQYDPTKFVTTETDSYCGGGDCIPFLYWSEGTPYISYSNVTSNYIFDLAGNLVAKGSGEKVEPFDVTLSGKVTPGAAYGTYVDIDGDGVMELVTYVYGQGWGIMKWNRSKGQFEWMDSYPMLLAHGPYRGPNVADVDNDNRLEVFYVSDDNKLYCYRLGENSSGPDRVWWNRWLGLNGGVGPVDYLDTFESPTNRAITVRSGRYYKGMIAFSGDVDLFRFVYRGSLIGQFGGVPKGKTYIVEVWKDDEYLDPNKTPVATSTGNFSYSTAYAGAPQNYYTFRIYGKTPSDWHSSDPYYFMVKPW